MTLHVVEELQGRRPPKTVFIHGAMDRHNSFRRTARRLLEHQIVIYDRRGYGNSARAGATCDFSRHVADLMELVGDESVLLVGHSMGALVALHAAAVYPDRVLAVAAFEPPLPWESWWPSQWIPSDDDSDHDVVRSFHERIIGSGSWDRIASTLQSQYLGEGHALRNDLTVGLDGPLFDPVDVRAPVVLGHGTDSTDYHIRAATELVEHLPDARLVAIDNAQHGAHRSHPDAFADFVRATHDRLDEAST